MLKHIVFACVICVLFSCNSKEKTKETVIIVDGTERYDVYQGSEMANLMKGMHAFNLQIKQEVIKGEVVTEFPEEFLKIYSAEFSESKSRNQTFDHYSGQFIEAQKLVFTQDSDTSLTQRYNNAINVCITCHQTECTGPIPKIKKLLIK